MVALETFLHVIVALPVVDIYYSFSVEYLYVLLILVALVLVDHNFDDRNHHQYSNHYTNNLYVVVVVYRVYDHTTNLDFHHYRMLDIVRKGFHQGMLVEGSQLVDMEVMAHKMLQMVHDT